MLCRLGPVIFGRSLGDHKRFSTSYEPLAIILSSLSTGMYRWIVGCQAVMCITVKAPVSETAWWWPTTHGDVIASAGVSRSSNHAKTFLMMQKKRENTSAKAHALVDWRGAAVLKQLLSYSYVPFLSCVVYCASFPPSTVAGWNVLLRNFADWRASFNFKWCFSEPAAKVNKTYKTNRLKCDQT